MGQAPMRTGSGRAPAPPAGKAPARAGAAPARTAPRREEAPAGNLKGHGTWSAEDAEAEFADSQASGAGADFLKLKTGRTVLRFLPPREGATSPFQVVHQHYIEVPGAAKGVTFTCPRMHKQGRCPACEHANKLRDTGNPADYDRAGKFLPRRRVFANAIDRADPERGVVIVPMGKQLHEQLLAIRKSPEAGGDFTDPSDAGFDVVVEKTGEGLKTEYRAMPARHNSALGDDEWLDQMHDLSRLSRTEGFDDIVKKMGGEGSPGGGSRGAAPQGRGRAPAPRGAPARRTAEDDAEQTGEEEAQE